MRWPDGSKTLDGAGTLRLGTLRLGTLRLETYGLETLSALKTRVARAVALGVLALGSGLGLAALAAWLIARAWQMPPVLDLSIAVVSVRALGISRGLGRYLERLATHDVALRAMAAARVGVYRRLASADAAAVSRLRRGSALTAIGADIDALGAVVVRTVVPLAVAVAPALAAVALMAAISMQAAVILVAALALSGAVAPALAGRAARAAEHDSAADRARYAGHAMIALDHAAELRVAGRLDVVLRAAKQAADDAIAAADRAAARGAWAAAATPLAVGATVLGVLLIACQPTPLPPTELAVMGLLPLSAFEAVAAMPAAAQAWNRARTCRLIGRAQAPQPVPPAALRARGEGPRRVAIVGPSGTGKTTLLQSWAGGEAMFFAEDAHIFDTSLVENLRVARGDLTDAEAADALRRVGLADWLTGLPDGIHTHLVGGAAAVSGGQRRRILLARALISPARVLLLDEPTEHLDVIDGAMLLRELLDPRDGLVAPDRTVVVVTHQLPTDHTADIVLTLPLPADFSFAENPLRVLVPAT